MSSSEKRNFTDEEIAKTVDALKSMEITPEMMRAARNQSAEAMRLLKVGLANLPGQIRGYKEHQKHVEESIKRGAKPSRNGRIPSGRIV